MATTLSSRAEVLALFSRLWNQHLDSKDMSDEDILALATMVRDDLQVRDYLLGFPIELVESGMEQDSALRMFGRFIAELGSRLRDTNDNSLGIPFAVLIGAFSYELGMNDLARECFTTALAVDSGYNLANALLVTIEKNPEGSLWGLRGFCHPKVKAHMELDTPYSELNNE